VPAESSFNSASKLFSQLGTDSNSHNDTNSDTDGYTYSYTNRNSHSYTDDYTNTNGNSGTDINSELLQWNLWQ
jgi:hypothetical protein